MAGRKSGASISMGPAVGTDSGQAPCPVPHVPHVPRSGVLGGCGPR